MKIAVLTSGGVDSSVALRLLHEQGHEVTAFYLKVWLEDELSYLGDCPWEEDLKFVEQVCRSLRFGRDDKRGGRDDRRVPLKIIPMQREYWNKVVRYTIREAKAGRTPNPDILCNQFIKFGLFYDRIGKEFEKVATGHYAQVEEKQGLYYLKRSPDPIKDQTYFLGRLNQKQLSRALFPIGHLTKKEVRALAKKYKLPNQNRKDSQGICFLGKFKYREFIKHHLGEKPGDFIDIETKKIVGEHKGYWFYTIGQRQGLNLSGGPWFVVKKDVKKNHVYIARGYQPEAVKQDRFKVETLRWITSRHSESPGTVWYRGRRISPIALSVKIRHGEAMYPCSLKLVGSRATVILKKPIHGIAPGQFTVFYRGQYCLGTGVID